MWANSTESPDGRWAILIAGISGDEDLQREFLAELREMRALLEGPLQFPRERIFVLADDPAKDPERVQYKSTRENLERICRDLATRVGKDDLVFIFIEGHGSFDGGRYKLNLVGPDPTGSELAAILNAIPAGQTVVFNATTCSGASIADLSKPGRIVATSTRSGSEKNRTHAGRYFVEAFRNNNADADHNGRVSILEAFAYARQKVEGYYASGGNLQTEHPVLDDDGDGHAHDNPGPDNGDGLLARTTYLQRGSAASARALNAEEQELARESQALEKKIEALRYSKASMPETEYEKQLEALLVRLAEINAKLRKK